MDEIYQGIVAALEKGESVALATIIQANSHWSVGAKLLVRHDASTLGSLGDERLARLVAPTAQRSILAARSHRLGYVERNGALVDASPLQVADVEIFIEVLQPSPTLLLIGAGHIGEALVKLAKVLAWHIVVVDDRPDFITPARLPQADQRIRVHYDPETETLDPMSVTITPSTFVVVATWGWDQPALRQIVNVPAAYIGLVASTRKGIIIFRELIKEGISPEALARVHVPTGLDLGAENQSEIALSILAEMLMVGRGGSGAPLMRSKGSAVMQQATRQL